MKKDARLLALALLACVILPARGATGTEVPVKPTEAFSMTISGGVSLGIYEAGVNWAIVETLRDEYFGSGKKLFRLDGVTGASAGAINALLSAIRFCQAERPREMTDFARNMFQGIWSIGLDELLPRNSLYEDVPIELSPDKSDVLADALFTRTPFAERLRRLEETVDSESFEPGCAVDVAMIVSRSVPQRLVLDTQPISRVVPVQRFVVPLTARVRPDERSGSSRFVFENHAGYAALARETGQSGSTRSGLRPQYLLLPEQNGEVPFRVVVRAALASSAFPIAFGRVKLQYCSPDSTGAPPEVRTGRCPDDHYLRSGFFIDGGVFDNIPVGTAVEMATLPRRGKAIPRSFVYLDPGNTIEGLIPKSDTPDRGSNAVARQLQVALSTLSTLRKQQLSADLGSYFAPEEERNLLVSTRTIPLVGSYLGGFAAFLDPSFFLHDYAAGLYDGLLNVARYLCAVAPEDADPGCQGNVYPMFDILAERLLRPPVASGSFRPCDLGPCVEQQLIRELVMQFRADAVNSLLGDRSCPQLTPDIDPNAVPGRAQVLAVTAIICPGTIGDFQSLVRAVDTARRRGFSLEKRWSYGNTFEYIADNGDGRWRWGIADHILSRLSQIEKRQQGAYRTLIGTARAMLPSVDPYTQGGDDSLWSRAVRIAVPQTIGIDGFQSGVFATWEPVDLRFEDGNCSRLPTTFNIREGCRRLSLAAGGGFHLRRVENRHDRFNTVSLQLGFRYRRGGRFVFSSIGSRRHWNVDYLPAVDESDRKSVYGSWELYMNFFGDKLTVSLGFEEAPGSIGNDDLSLRIGISDLQRILPFMRR